MDDDEPVDKVDFDSPVWGWVAALLVVVAACMIWLAFLE